MANNPDITRNPDGSYMTNEQVADHMFSLMHPDSKHAIRKVPIIEDMIKYHHGVGTGIRNEYGMWNDDNPHSNINVDGPNFPDQRSHEVLKMIWQKVHNA